KYSPHADTALDLTVKPDLSQVESDTAQISANERFALFFPEKRPFFLEGADLFQTPIQAVYTRTITAPRWGARATGKEGGVRYTVLVADDAGGGTGALTRVYTRCIKTCMTHDDYRRALDTAIREYEDLGARRQQIDS